MREPVKGLNGKNSAFYLVMKRIKGRQLFKVIDEMHAQGNIDARQLLLMTKEILLAVQRFHALGRAHFDIKLENMVLGDDGKVYLVDAAFAKRESDPLEWRVGCGPVGHMSQEQLAKASVMDQKTDIFQLGYDLGTVWGASEHETELDKPYQFQDLFAGIAKIPGLEKIETLLNQMVSFNPDDRCSVEHALKVVRQLLGVHFKEEPIDIVEIVRAYRMAKNELSMLRSLHKEHAENIDGALSKEEGQNLEPEKMIELTCKFNSKCAKIRSNFALFRTTSATVSPKPVERVTPSLSYSDFFNDNP